MLGAWEGATAAKTPMNNDKEQNQIEMECNQNASNMAIAMNKTTWLVAMGAAKSKTNANGAENNNKDEQTNMPTMMSGNGHDNWWHAHCMQHDDKNDEWKDEQQNNKDHVRAAGATMNNFKWQTMTTAMAAMMTMTATAVEWQTMTAWAQWVHRQTNKQQVKEQVSISKWVTTQAHTVSMQMNEQTVCAKKWASNNDANNENDDNTELQREAINASNVATATINAADWDVSKMQDQCKWQQ